MSDEEENLDNAWRDEDITPPVVKLTPIPTSMIDMVLKLVLAFLLVPALAITGVVHTIVLLNGIFVPAWWFFIFPAVYWVISTVIFVISFLDGGFFCTNRKPRPKMLAFRFSNDTYFTPVLSLLIMLGSMVIFLFWVVWYATGPNITTYSEFQSATSTEAHSYLSGCTLSAVFYYGMVGVVILMAYANALARVFFFNSRTALEGGRYGSLENVFSN